MGGFFEIGICFRGRSVDICVSESFKGRKWVEFAMSYVEVVEGYVDVNDGVNRRDYRG